MRRFISNQRMSRQICLLALALLAGMMVQNQAHAQRRGGGGGKKGGGGMQQARSGGNQGGSLGRGNGSSSSGMQALAGGNSMLNGNRKKFQGNSQFGNGSGLTGRLQSGNKFNGNQFAGGQWQPGNGGPRFAQGAGKKSGNSPLNQLINSGNRFGNSALGILPGQVAGNHKLAGGQGSGQNQARHGNGNWRHLQQQWCHQPSHVLVNHCHHVRRHAHLHWHYDKWCGYFPARCHWWYRWCGSQYYFDPTCCVSYNWYYYPCQVRSGAVVQQITWHLGLNCVYIPGRGLGVQDVEAGSPAEQAGLAAGMVIVKANGVELTKEGLMQDIIASSNGLLNLGVLPTADGELADVAIQLVRLNSSNF